MHFAYVNLEFDFTVQIIYIFLQFPCLTLYTSVYLKFTIWIPNEVYG